MKTLVHTLVSVYDRVDNGISNCMALIILDNDPEFKYFDEELKTTLINATKRKLKDILEYLKTENPDQTVFEELEVVVDLACYLRNKEISVIIDEIDNYGFNENADIFIIKYKIINNMGISNKKLDMLKQDEEKL